WQGSIKDLLAALNAKADEQDRRDPAWPKGEKALASALSRIDANLHATGYGVRWLKRDSRTRRRIVRLDQKSKPSTVEFRTAVVAGHGFDLDVPSIDAICKILECTKIVQTPMGDSITSSDCVRGNGSN